MNPLAVLGRFTAPLPVARAPSPACELCREPIGAGHAHVLDVGNQTSCCVCRACALLFTDPRPDARYMTIGDRVLVDPELALDDALWARLGIPVRLAFFTWQAGGGAVQAVYPAAAGATRAEVPPEPWAELAACRLVRALRPPVEALLLCGLSAGPLGAMARAPGGSSVASAGFECFGVPIDRCFALMGLLRENWRGFSGGQDLWRQLEAYFAELRACAKPVPPEKGPGL